VLWTAGCRQVIGSTVHSPQTDPNLSVNFVANLPADFGYELVRVIADGDLVALHGTYHGFGPEPLVAFDIFRVADGKLAEHWDVMQPAVTTTVRGEAKLTGPTKQPTSARPRPTGP